MRTLEKLVIQYPYQLPPTSPTGSVGLERNTVLAIQQIIMLAELAVKRALDRVDPQA